MKTKLIFDIAKNCEWHKTVNDKYMPICENNIFLCEQVLPHGSGIDAGCKIDIEKSGKNKVVINFGYHHMDENGYYCGWTEHKAIVTPEFNENGYILKITGTNKNQIKDYLYDTFIWQFERTGNIPENN